MELTCLRRPDFPSYSFPSLIGRPILRAEERSSLAGNTANIHDIMIGDEASENRTFLQLSTPLEHGIIRNWDDMKLIWNYTFSEKLRVDPRGRSILLTEAPMNPIKNREKMCEIMFEDYGFQRVYVAIQAVLTLYAQGAPLSAPRAARADSRIATKGCKPVWSWTRETV